MENTMKEMTIVPITGQVISETTMGLDVPYIDAEEVFDNENHPNFIESNTQAISLEDLTSKNIIPTFGDNTLTISHQSFIGAVTRVAEQVFGKITVPELNTLITCYSFDFVMKLEEIHSMIFTFKEKFLPLCLSYKWLI